MSEKVYSKESPKASMSMLPPQSEGEGFCGRSMPPPPFSPTAGPAQPPVTNQVPGSSWFNFSRSQEGENEGYQSSIYSRTGENGNQYTVGSNSMSAGPNGISGSSSMFSATTPAGGQFDLMRRDFSTSDEGSMFSQDALNAQWANGAEARLGSISSENGWMGEEGERRFGTRSNAALLSGRTPETLPVGIEGSVLSGEAELTAGQDGASGRLGYSLASATARSGNHDSERNNDQVFKISGGVGGWGVDGGLHWGDSDNDGYREYGFHLGGEFLAGLGIDIKTEDPLRTLMAFGTPMGQYMFGPGAIRPVLPETNMTHAAIDATGRAIDSGSEIASEAWDSTKGAISDGYESGKVWASETLDDGVEWAGNTWDSTRETAGEALDTAQEWAGNTWDSTRETAGEALNTAQEWTGNAWDSTTETASNAWNNTKDLIGGWFD